jgi:methyl-accepting chemotaxis protein
MTIRMRLQVLAVVTIIVLGGVLLAVIMGLQSIQEAQEASGRRETYVRQVLEIKASANATILLDPASAETKNIFTAAEKTLSEQGQAVIAVIKRPEIKDEFRRVLDGWTSYDKHSRELIELAATDAKMATGKLETVYQTDFKPFQAALDKFVTDRVKDADKARETAKSTEKTVFWIVVPITVVGIVVILTFVFLLSHALGTGLAGILAKLEPLRQGRLKERLPITGNDELGQIAVGMNSVIEALQNLVQEVHAKADGLATAADQLSTDAKHVAEGSVNQSDSASATAAAIEQLTVSVAHIAESAEEVRQLSAASLEGALKGSQSIAQLQNEITTVQTSVESIASSVRTFVDNTRTIAGMTNQIREIADQTNLLALNAAIEAARAGEQGRGFAVVADEVRKLAERSATSAGEITAVTERLNGQSVQVGESIEAGLAALQTSLQFVDTVVAVFNEARDTVRRTSAGVDDVSAAVHEQQAASTEIARNVERIARMTEENSAVSRDSATASRGLNDLARTLQNSIRQFTA